MRLLSFPNSQSQHVTLQTERLTLRTPNLDDFKVWSALRKESKEHLQPWEPKWRHDELSRASFKSRLRQQQADFTSKRGKHWFLILNDRDATLVGGISVTNIRLGIAQTGTIGYWTGAPFAGQGYMREALQAVCSHAFDSVGLHRLEAATVVENHRSQRLLLSCGFEEEGKARGYLKINDRWRDHLLFARLAIDATHAN